LDERPPVELLLLWHHHQPDYRNPRDGAAALPWVRLHATKDYLDMALRLERHPSVRATFNFVPSLLDQLDALVAGAPELLFDLLRRPIASLNPGERAEVIARCAVAPPHAFDRWPGYRALVRRLAPSARGDRRGAEGTDDDLLALEIWFLLAWLDPMFLSEPEAVAAFASESNFREEIRDGLLILSSRLVARVIPTYRALAERGQIELSESAYDHPILPLLVDVRVARRARPDLALPAEPFAAPADATLQIERAFERHRQAFGARPTGMWPPEGSVSPEVVELAARAGARWLATDEAVLWRSLPAGARERGALYRPWRCESAAGPVTLLFRDHELSDRIGFVYHHWEAADAVADFIARLRRIARDGAAAQAGTPLVSVILDGENCWERYPGDGGPFLDALYAALAAAPDIRTRTPSDVLDVADAPILQDLHSGSWIDADFHIWIGHPEKNRAWDLLARARRALTETGHTPENAPHAWASLFAAEGSDWFWWLGEDHYTADKALFDRLFREHLQAVYERADLEVPAWLHVPVARLGAGPERISAPLGYVRPTLDGAPTQFYEWHAAGRYRPLAGGGSMHRGAGLVRDLYFGFDERCFYLRLDFTGGPPGPGTDLVLDVLAPRASRLAVRGLGAGAPRVIAIAPDGAEREIADASCRIQSVLELGIPIERMDLAAGDAAELLVRLLQGGEPIETLPNDELLRVTVPDAAYAASMWSV
jgi:alpha-amylase/alpha-mannosidase (GH57 family)